MGTERMSEKSEQAVRPSASRVYGPVLSRRLGRSLGVDLVPYKVCPFNCVYCQLGPTTRLTATRATFFPVQDLVNEILAKAETSKPDTITLAGSGEPTLYKALSALIGGIKAATKVPVALLTNGALFGDPEVRREAALCDLLIPSLDAGEECFFQWVNRPLEGLTLEKLTEGLVLFRDSYRGPIWLEVMVLQGLTEQRRHLRAIAERAKRIRPDKIQLNTPIRPSSHDFVFPVSPDRLEEFCAFFDPIAEVIAQPPNSGTSAPFSPEAAAPILEMLWRRPCTLEDICAGLGTGAPAALKVLESLVNEGKVYGVLRSGRYFFDARRDGREQGQP